MGSANVFWGSQNDFAALCINILGFDMLYSLSEMVFSTSGWIMKTNIVSASSLIIQDETEFRPIISCQNVWGVARLGKWILWGPRTKSLRTTALAGRIVCSLVFIHTQSWLCKWNPNEVARTEPYTIPRTRKQGWNLIGC